MKRPRYKDFECTSCGYREERFVETEDDDSLCEEQRCTHVDTSPETTNGICDQPMIVLILASAPLAAPLAGKDVKTNLDDAARQRERLEKRGDDHWKREGRHEAIERERAMLAKNGMGGAGGVR
jgi:hypothetical protein